MTPMGRTILTEILEHKREVIRQNRGKYADFRRTAKPRKGPHVFKSGISHPGGVNLIAEIKKASPSRGLIRKDFDVLAVAKIYADHQAAALSILTEDKYFQGRPEDIRQVSQHVPLPVLAKDFFLDEGQIYEALANGASAILLIVAALDKRHLKDLFQMATALGLDSLVEIHDHDELDQALAAGAEMIGINNRDLATFDVDLGTCLRIVPDVPKGKVVVAESGYKAHDEIRSLKQAGVSAVLIGETFMRAPDIGAKIKEVMHGSG